MDKWDKQGGSNRDNINKPRKKKRISESIIRPLKSLKESDSVSPKIVAQKKPIAQYGQFGDDVQFIIDPVTDLLLPEIKINDYEYELRPNVTPVRILDDKLESFRENKGEDLLPRKMLSRYEIFVRFGRGAPILIIMPGQAYMARTGINNERFDRSLVVISDTPIIFDANLLTGLGTVTASTTNVIKLNNNTNSEYQIVDSLYRWVNELTGLITDITGLLPNPILVGLNSNNAPQLPSINFTANSELYGLFGGLGRQVDQICLAAIDTVLEFDRKDNTLNTSIEPYSVLLAGARIAVCSPRVAIIQIQYRIISIFFTSFAMGLRYGGYDLDGNSVNIVDPYNITPITNTFPNNVIITSSRDRILYSLNIINPVTAYWHQIEPRNLEVDPSTGLESVKGFYKEFCILTSTPTFNKGKFVFTLNNGTSKNIRGNNPLSSNTLNQFIDIGGGSRVFIGYLASNLSPQSFILDNSANGQFLGINPYDIIYRDSRDNPQFVFGVKGAFDINQLIVRYGILVVSSIGVSHYTRKFIRLPGFINTNSFTSIPANPTPTQNRITTLLQRQLISYGTTISIDADLNFVESGSLNIEPNDINSSAPIGSLFDCILDANYALDSNFSNVRSETNIVQVIDQSNGQVRWGVANISLNVNSNSIESQSLQIKTPIRKGQLTIYKGLNLLNTVYLQSTSIRSEVTTPLPFIFSPTPPSTQLPSTPFSPNTANVTTLVRNSFESSLSETKVIKNCSIDPIYSIGLINLNISQVFVDLIVPVPSLSNSISIPVNLLVESTKINEVSVTRNVVKVATPTFTSATDAVSQIRTSGTSPNSVTNDNNSIVISTSKRRSYEILESVNFTLITSNKIYNYRVASLVYTDVKVDLIFNQTTGSVVSRGTLSDELFLINDITNINVISGFASPQIIRSNPSGFTQFSETLNYVDSVSVTGFGGINLDNYTPVGSQYYADGSLNARRITQINATLINSLDHFIPDYVPLGQSRLLIPNMKYFSPNTSIIAKADPSRSTDDGILSRIYKTQKTSQTTAVVESWIINNDGRFELTDLLDEPLGGYPGSTERIYYYPGDVQL